MASVIMQFVLSFELLSNYTGFFFLCTVALTTQKENTVFHLTWHEVISILGGSPYVAAKINEAKDLLEDQAKKWEKSLEGLSMQMIIFDKWLKKSSNVSLWLNINEAGNMNPGRYFPPRSLLRHFLGKCVREQGIKASLHSCSLLSRKICHSEVFSV